MRTLEEQLTINRNCKFHPESKEELQKLVSDPKINLGLIDTSNISDMSWLFKNCCNFNQAIGNWNVSRVTDMHDMFRSCVNFNQDLTQWKVKETCNTQNMFTDTPLRLANVKEVFTEKQLLNSASQIFLNELTLK